MSSRRFTELEEQAIASEYAAGTATTRLSEQYSVSVPTIIRIILRSGTVIRSRRIFTEAQEREIESAYLSGVGAVALGRQYGCSQPGITQILHRRGVPLHNEHERRRRYTVRSDAFDTIAPDSAYALGLYMTDGNIAIRCNGRHVAVSLRLAQSDAQILYDLRDWLQATHPVQMRPISAAGVQAQAALTIHDPHIAARLIELGCTPNKSYTAQVATGYGLTRSADFWRGCIDGDGSVTYTNHRPEVRLCGASPLVCQFQEFVSRVFPGYTPTADRRPHTPCVSIQISGMRALCLMALLYGGEPRLRLQRKYDVARTAVREWHPRRSPVDRSYSMHPGYVALLTCKRFA